MIDRVWSSIERGTRRSFLNYYLMFFNLLELTGQTELLPQAPLLRTRLRLRQHDLVWKNICDEIGWPWRQRNKAYANHSGQVQTRARKRKPPQELYIHQYRPLFCSLPNHKTKSRELQ